MSSFIINKEEYIKVAGLLAGIKAIKGEKFFLYDYQRETQVREDKDFLILFNDFFQMNCISFYEQYSPRHEDLKPYTDDNDYIASFNEYKAIGKKMALYPAKLGDLVMEIRNFFHSALYQTENEAYHNKMMFVFNQIIDALLPCTTTYHPETWGELDLSNFKDDLKNCDTVQILF